MLPSVTFIIPALNSEKTLEKTIRSINDQRYPKELTEIIVVNNGSTDRTKEIGLASGARVLDVKKRNRSLARNSGWKEAKHDLIAFIDSDVFLDPEWLTGMVSKLTGPGIAGGQGKIIPTGEQTSFNEFRKELSAWRTYQTFNSLKIISVNTPMVNTAACVYRKEVLVEVGGFDEFLVRHEDVDLSKRISRRGYHFVAVESATAFVVWHGSGWFDYLLRSFDIGLQRRPLEEKWKLTSRFEKKLRTTYLQQKKNFASFSKTHNSFWLKKSLVETIVECGRFLSIKRYPTSEVAPSIGRTPSLVIFEDEVHALDTASGKVFRLEAYHALPLLFELKLITFEECRERLKTMLNIDFDLDLHREIIKEVVETGLELGQA